MKKPDNNTHSFKKSRLRGDEHACFDHLPSELRRALHEAVVDWCTLEARRDLNRLVKAGFTQREAINALVLEYRTAEAAEIERFAHCWPARFGRYPHVAAEATILRYGRR